MPVPWVAVQKWVETYKLDNEQASWLHFLVRELDGVYLAHARQKAKDAQRSGNK